MLSIITPTFNRAHTLPRLFQSLQAQVDKRFEWIVVDDGSTDDTASLLNEFQNKKSCSMTILSQKNSGKHVAINKGVRAAQGEWVVILDSDDALTPDAVATILQTKETYKLKTGFCFRKEYFQGGIVGKKFSSDSPFYLHPSQANKVFQGDLTFVFQREVMRNFPFPVIPGECFVPELYIWNLIGDQGDILYFPTKSIYLCEYLPDGYSANFAANFQRNPQGFLLFYVTQIHREQQWLGKGKCLVRCLQCVLRLGFKGVSQ